MKIILFLFFFFFHEEPSFYCEVLKESYVDSVISCDKSMELKDGSKIPFLDKSLKRDVDSMMENPDVYSNFFYNYNKITRLDAGRIRLYKLLKVAYGKEKKEIVKNLERCNFLGKNIFFNKNNGALRALRNVDAELQELLIVDPKLKVYTKNPQSFIYREIAGTKLLSSHSFGIAIDIGIKKSQYWRWNKRWKEVKNINFPDKIVEVFEKHGFIWGGRWEHYDSMHFEYRPEFLLLKRKRSR